MGKIEFGAYDGGEIEMSVMRRGSGRREGVFAAVQSGAREHERLIRYFVIGCSASAIDLSIFFALHTLVGASPLLAHSVSVPTAVLFSFFVNARHNFRRRDRVALRLLSFSLVCAVGYILGYAVISLAELLGLSANIGKVLSLPVVFVTQYLLNSKITFADWPIAGRAHAGSPS